MAEARRRVRAWLLALACGSIPCTVWGAAPAPLTLEAAVGLAMENSYRIRELKLGVRRSRLYLKARQAQLKSSVSMDLVVPQFEGVSDYKWNSNLRRNEIVRQNTRLWEMGLSVSQPLVLFGTPTDGYLSLNSRINRYDQAEGDDDISSYYNRHYLQFEQPLFRPNELRNDLEEAELSLEREDLEFLEDQVELIDDVADQFYDVLAVAQQEEVLAADVEVLEDLLTAARDRADRDSLRHMETVQVQIELENAKEALRANQRDQRVESDRLRQRIGMEEGQPIDVEASTRLRPLEVDLDEALGYGLSLRPAMRLHDISIREQEIDVENTKGDGGPHVDLEMTYGLEKQDEGLRQLWDQYDNSYSVGVRVSLPVWDWGRRQAEVEAERLGLRETELRKTETQESIAQEIVNAVTDLLEFQRRTLSMRENSARARQMMRVSAEQYRQGRLSLQDALRAASTQKETDLAFLDAYLGYRRAVLNLAVVTHFDFETGAPLLDRLTPDPG